MISFLCSSVQIVDLTACLYLTCNLPCWYFLNVYCHVLDFDLWCEPWLCPRCESGGECRLCVLMNDKQRC